MNVGLILFEKDVFRASEIVAVEFVENVASDLAALIYINLRGFPRAEFEYEYDDFAEAERKYQRLIQDWKEAEHATI